MTLLARSLFPLSVLSLLLPLGCEGEPQTDPRHVDRVSSVAPSHQTEPPTSEPAPIPPLRPKTAGCDTVRVMRDGQAAGEVCVQDAGEHGLTVVDLSDTWTPRVFAASAADAKLPEYRAKYLSLAAQPSGDLGLYGVAPNLSILAARLFASDCEVPRDTAALAELRAARLTAKDERAKAALTKGATARPAWLSIQAELICEGLLRKSAQSGAPSNATHAALDAFRRRHMIVGSGLDEDTLRALALGRDELAFRGLLRGLRERVADAQGLIEDGTATGQHALVVDRELDLSAFGSQGHPPIADGVGDLVDIATDLAARQLGWTSGDAARAFVAERGGKSGLETLRIALPLPAKPSYHSAQMDLRVEIDRGDVFYETPGAAAAARKKLAEVRRPSFVVYAKDGETDRAILRWPTTIGGWQKERTEEGEITLKYKESDVGDRYWRQIIAAPAWMPPDSTPETDLLREDREGNVTLKRDLIQPGHRNAYGLVMIMHEQQITRGDKVTWHDRGIRTHGSVNYRSLARGESHGCHRLYNQLALRLSGYLLDHRAHQRRGKLKVGYQRTLLHNEQTIEFSVPERGFLYELDPPIPVRVLKGNVAGEQQKPGSAIRLASG